MAPKNKESSPGIAHVVGRSVNFELTIADMARRSERRAWLVAATASAMALVLAGGYFYVLPLKEKVPYLVMADAYTGTSTVARLSGDFGKAGITTSEAINRSNVAHFVLARESYDYALIRLRDWATVYTMSSPAVASGYTRLHSPRNPDSPYNTYGKSRSIRVSILSIQLIGDGNGGPQGATVRFQRSLYDSGTGIARPLDSKIATLGFSYKPNLGMDEKERIENPLGFQVTSYRVDNDYGSAPPLEQDELAGLDASAGQPMEQRTAGAVGDSDAPQPGSGPGTGRAIEASANTSGTTAP